MFNSLYWSFIHGFQYKLYFSYMKKLFGRTDGSAQHTWTVKFQVETVPRVATLHLACYGAACVVSRPQPLLMASTWLSLAKTNVQWQQQQLLQCKYYKCGIEQDWWLNIAIYFIIGSDFHCLICVYRIYFVPDFRQVFLSFDINHFFLKK